MARSQHLSAHLLAPSFAAALALAALVPTLGCGNGTEAPSAWITFDACQPLTLALDPGAPSAESDGVAAGIALWNAAAGTKLALGVGSDPASEPAGADAGTPATLPVHFQQAAAPFHGLYDAPSGQIFINTDLTDHQLAVTVAHEVGHAFGLVHRTDQPSLMNPSNLMIEPQPVDIKTLETRWGACR